MIPLAILTLCLGWCDLPPAPAVAPRCPVRQLSNRERRRATGQWK